ncbi:molybdate ABC transporter substrate-binding protein [soil metagenome]
MRKHLSLTIAVLAALAFVVSGCSSDSDDTAASTTTAKATTTTEKSVSGTIVVSAAASLTGAFTTIKDDFVTANPDASITINFGSSGALATQIQEGAPADVAAFADTTPMTTLEDAGLLAAAPEIFARNQLIIVTKPGNPAGIKTLADLATAGTISLCVDTAPCGKFGNQILATAGVTIPEGSISRGTDVKSTLTAVSEGDAVAGIVYVTDAESVDDQVANVDIHEAENVIASYPIAVVEATANSELADAFQAYVLSDDGQAVLKEAGFLAP